MAGIYLSYAACRVPSKVKHGCYHTACTSRRMQTGRLINRHLLAFMSFEERCINFQLILANIIELQYANFRTFELCKALDHCETYTIAYIRRKGGENQDMQSIDKKKADGRT
ncbi:uncharacterized protein Bfra_001996 [Botrytis fragariae]|uniref:Uncharacterized protein n=1 Tax=Botrytis fragariae TaxID=1964551 RepID=A0A8H6B1F7_9HELO|nr:uncharacterized protein Bfra_001996 [Botrytis fragariae]KAF5877629.1 hypothetical protein Bfra_001996 [Botrytis fragariae]